MKLVIDESDFKNILHNIWNNKMSYNEFQKYTKKMINTYKVDGEINDN